MTLDMSKILASRKTVEALPLILVETGLYLQFCQGSIINIFVFKVSLDI